jgi:hypothetical protein
MWKFPDKEVLRKDHKILLRNTMILGITFGALMMTVVWAIVECQTRSDIIYTHTHEGPVHETSRFRCVVRGATFGEMQDLIGKEKPMTIADFLDDAKDDFKSYKLLEQHNREYESPIKRVEVRVWK